MKVTKGGSRSGGRGRKKRAGIFDHEASVIVAKDMTSQVLTPPFIRIYSGVLRHHLRAQDDGARRRMRRRGGGPQLPPWLPTQ